MDKQPTTPLETDSQKLEAKPRHGLRRWLLLALLVIAVQLVVITFLAVRLATAPAAGPTAQTNNMIKPDPDSTASSVTPELDIQEVVGNRDHVWDIAFLPTKELVFSERNGNIRLVKDGQTLSLASVDNVAVRGEGGLMGLAVDPDFSVNRFLYACLNSTSGDIRVSRWKVRADLTGLTDRSDIINAIPSNPSGRHSGCQLEFGPDGYLWTGTGDTAQALTPQSPQDPKSLAGKILRTNRDGKAAPGNQGGSFDSRIYSYGHRNTQGLAFFARPIGGAVGVSVEHGSAVDDEVNPLRTGNFGWAPPDGPYDESVSMTDTDRFPNAVKAVWKSGNPTQAPSGIAVLTGSQWKGWNGALATSILKDKHLKVLRLSDSLAVTKEERALEGDFGRLRAAVQGPDGALYVSTDNGGGQDKVIRVAPRP